MGGQPPRALGRDCLHLPRKPRRPTPAPPSSSEAGASFPGVGGSSALNPHLPSTLPGARRQQWAGTKTWLAHTLHPLELAGENSGGTRELESEASLQAEDKGRQKTKAAQWWPRMRGWGAPGQWGSVGRR